MLDKQFEIAVIGKNYLSIMYGLKMLVDKNRVIVINDKRASLGGQILCSHGRLEVELLKQWGKMEGIDQLSHIDQHITPRYSTFHLPTGRLKLGSSSPSNNLREILRKLPFFFEGDSQLLNSYVFDKDLRDNFDIQYFQYLNFLSHFALNSRSGNDFEREFIVNTLPPEMKKLFLLFEKNYLKKKNEGIDWDEKEWSVKLINFIANCYLHYSFSIDQEFYQVFHIFLYLIGPFYHIDDRAVESSLESLFVEKGGVIKNARLKEWVFYKGYPWSIELDSFEGIFHPKKLTYFGGIPTGLPMKIETTSPILKQVTLKTKINKPHLSKSNDKLIHDFYYCNKDMIGGEFALWKITETEEYLYASCPVLFYPGTKIDFFEKRIVETFNSEIKKIIPGFMSEQWDVFWDHDIFHQKLRSKKRKPNQFKDKIFDYSGPSKVSLIKDFKNFGPMGELPLGFISCLMKMRQ
jgi:hypothetical protein